MGHIVPVARWFGFGFGYSVAEAVALVAAGWAGGRPAVLLVAHTLNITFLLIFAYAMVRIMFRLWWGRRERAAGPLGTYAKSKSRRDAGAAGSGALGA